MWQLYSSWQSKKVAARLCIYPVEWKCGETATRCDSGTRACGIGPTQQKSTPRQYSHEIDLRSGLAQLPLVQLSCRLAFQGH